MATVGSFVVNTYMNNENFMAGVKASQSAAKKMESGIGSSMDKINQKQLGNFGKNILQGVGAISLVQAGTALATDFVKGFSDGSLKSMSDVAKKLQSSLEDALKNIPLAGGFFELGRAIQERFTGATKAANELAQWAKIEDAHNKKWLEDTKEITKAKQTLNEIVANQIKMDKENDPSRSKADKDETAYRQKIIASQKALDMAKEKLDLDSGKQAQMSAGQIDFEETERLKKNQEELNRLMFEYNKRQAENISQQEKLDAGSAATKLIESIKQRGSAEIAIGHEKERQRQDMENTLELAVSLGAITRDQMNDAIKYYEYVEGLEKTRIENAKKITDELEAQKNLNDMIADSENDLQQAQEDFDKTKASLEKEAAGLSSTTGIGSAIGEVKVAGSADFSIEKQLSMAQEALEAATDSVDYLRIIAENSKLFGATT